MALSPAARPRLTNAEKVARHRQRRARGIVAVVPVEIAEEVLPMLAAGGRTTVEALRADRHLLAGVAARALKHLARCFEATGGLPRVPPKAPAETIT